MKKEVASEELIDLENEFLMAIFSHLSSHYIAGLYEAVVTNRNFFTVLSHVMSNSKDVSDPVGRFLIYEFWC